MLSDVPSGWIKDYVTARHNLKKCERVECDKDKLEEMYFDFYRAIKDRHFI